jgi:hypothetical protein
MVIGDRLNAAIAGPGKFADNPGLHHFLWALSDKIVAFWRNPL